MAHDHDDHDDRDRKQAELERLAAELAGLSEAERYERLIQFPTVHMFKLIGPGEQSFTDAVRAALDELGHADAVLAPRFSSGAKYMSISVELPVESGARLVDLYARLRLIPGLTHLL